MIEMQDETQKINTDSKWTIETLEEGVTRRKT